MAFPTAAALLGLALSLSLAPATASARTADAGAVLVGGMLGPGFKVGPLLGGSGAYFTLAGQLEYMIDPTLSAVVDVDIGLAGTLPLRLHLGGRYRLSELGLPISPFVQAQLTVGRLFDVIGANLTYLGARVGVGAEYFLTSAIGVGALVGADLGSTTGDRPAFYGVVDVLLYATYGF